MKKSDALRWPQGKSGCMALAFDLDGPTGDAMLDGSLWQTPEYFTFGAYGPFRALERLLDMLRAFSLPATFFVPGWVVEQWPRQCQAIIEQGHEVAYHGYRHESFWSIPAEQQREVMRKSAEIFRNVLGITASGFRTPSGDWHPETPAILREAGVIYSSSMRGDDRPYSIPVEGHSPLVEIPGKWEMDDYASLAYTRQPDFPKGGDRIAGYDQTRDNWQREFDGAMDEGLCLTTLFHPKISGQPGRLLLLEKLFEHMTARDDVWFARCDAVAEWYLQEQMND